MSSVICTRCHAPIPLHGPQGLCARCMLALGMDDIEVVETGESLPERPPPTPEEIQSLFPHLEITRLIGRGGMGAVYEALQRGLNRRVALKLLWAPDAADAGFEQRFAREGRALAQLSHPNVVAVHDAGRSGPYYWLVMEFVEGVNLRELIRSGPLEAPRALAIVMQMCAALDYAHKRGIVHRDVKPENVLIARTGRVKIADFGLAKVLAREHLSPAITRSEQAMGTPHYMAPEQIERPRHVDHRADIYSLGVVLYEVLTGELPLGRFQMPSRKAEVDARLDEIVVRAMQKQPERRYQAASEVSTAIRHVSEKPVSVRARSARAPRREPVPWPMLGAAAAVLLAAGLLASKFGLFGAANAASMPEELYAKGRQLVEQEPTLQAGIDLLDEAYAKEPTLEGLRECLLSALDAGVDQLKYDRKYDEAFRRASRAQAIAPGPESQELVSSLRMEAGSYWSKVFAIRSPAEGEVLPGGVVVVQGIAAGSLEGAKLALDGARVSVHGNAFQESLGTLGDGRHEVNLTITTPSGLVISWTRRFAVDTQQPSLAVRTPRPGDLVGAKFTVHGTVTDTSRTTVSIGDRSYAVEAGTGPWQLEVELGAEGDQELEVIASDGRDLNASVTIPLVVDLTAPEIIDPAGRGSEIAWSSINDVILMRVEDDRRLELVTWDGQKVPFDASGQVRLRARHTEEGDPVPYRLLAKDGAGNEAEHVVVLRRDDTRPILVPGPETEKVLPSSVHPMEIAYEDRSGCVLVMDGSRFTGEDGKFVARKAIPSDRRPGETIAANFEVIDDAGNKTPGQRLLKVIEPCKDCIPVDGKRGTCKPCDGDGLGQKELPCPDCRRGATCEPS